MPVTQGKRVIKLPSISAAATATPTAPPVLASATVVTMVTRTLTMMLVALFTVFLELVAYKVSSNGTSQSAQKAVAGLVTHEVAGGATCQCRAQATLTFWSIRIEGSIGVLRRIGIISLALRMVRVVGILLLAVLLRRVLARLATIPTLVTLALLASIVPLALGIACVVGAILATLLSMLKSASLRRAIVPGPISGGSAV